MRPHTAALGGAKFSDIGPYLAEFGSDLAVSGPQLAEVGRFLAKFGPHRITFCRFWAEFWSTSGQFGSLALGERRCPKAFQCRPRCSKTFRGRPRLSEGLPRAFQGPSLARLPIGRGRPAWHLCLGVSPALLYRRRHGLRGRRCERHTELLPGSSRGLGPRWACWRTTRPPQAVGSAAAMQPPWAMASARTLGSALGLQSPPAMASAQAMASAEAMASIQVMGRRMPGGRRTTGP